MKNIKLIILLFIFLEILSFQVLAKKTQKNKKSCIGQKDNGTLCLIKEQGKIFVENKKQSAATVFFYALLDQNTVFNPRLPVNLVVPPKSRKLAFEFKNRDLRRPRKFGYKWSWVLGDMYTVPNEKYIYTLPFANDKKFKVSQGPSGAFSHQGKLKFAVDFAMKEGTKVHAIRDGLVVNVVQKFKESGTDPKLKEKVNYVAILHSDGTIVRYAHLKFKGSLVKVGERVAQGKSIALSGFTGYARGPHLHLELSRTLSGREYISLPIYFKTKKGIIQRMKKGVFYSHKI